MYGNIFLTIFFNAPDQIVKCDVEGDWDLAADSRKRLFTVANINTIICAFKQHIQF